MDRDIPTKVVCVKCWQEAGTVPHMKYCSKGPQDFDGKTSHHYEKVPLSDAPPPRRSRDERLGGSNE